MNVFRDIMESACPSMCSSACLCLRLSAICGQRTNNFSFSQCFLHCCRMFSHFNQILNCHLQTLSVLKILKFVDGPHIRVVACTYAKCKLSGKNTQTIILLVAILFKNNGKEHAVLCGSDKVYDS